MSETKALSLIPTFDSIRYRYNEFIAESSLCQIMQAAEWYSEAQAFALQLSTRYNVTLDTAAGVIAAFSPRTKWAQNVLNAELFLMGENVPALGNNIRMATKVQYEESISALKGRKTNSFAHNIAGDMDKVTIDVWMIRAAGYDRLDANKGMYNLMESVVIDLANEYNIKPAQAQALIWIRVRGSHD